MICVRRMVGENISFNTEILKKIRQVIIEYRTYSHAHALPCISATFSVIHDSDRSYHIPYTIPS
jgi:hypothetical protein